MAAIGFELFKQVASVYLQVVLRSPAGATFGPVLGLMVFAYVTAYLVLFCDRVGGDGGRQIRAPSPSTRRRPRSSPRGSSWTRASARARRWPRWRWVPLAR